MFFVFSCKKPVREEFTGKWVSEDKAMIILNEDSTCILQNIDPVKIWDSDSATKGKINGAGKWKFSPPDKWSGHYCIYVDSNKGSFPLYVMGIGHTGYFRPWKLFNFIGDPDNMDLYEFYKQ
jgi:hypothetical protein